MGITNLWPKLKAATSDQHLSDFKGQKAAIDGYIYLHRGVATLNPDQVKNGNTEGFMDSALGLITLLKQHGIIPIMVLDGMRLPAKAELDEERKRKRIETNIKAAACTVKNKMDEAKKLLQQGHAVTKVMVKKFIEKLRTDCVDYLVSPYESDSQLYFLEKIGMVDVVISTDSDLAVYGAKKIIFKLDRDGSCSVFDRSKLPQCYPKFNRITDTQFRRICILSGCDYLKNLRDIGPATATNIVFAWKNETIDSALKKIPITTNKSFTDEEIVKYIDNFRRAENTFLYQVVFDPINQSQRNLNHLPDFEDYSYAGKVAAKEFSVNFSLGNINPETMEEDDTFIPTEGDFCRNTVIWKEYGNKPSSTNSSSSFGYLDGSLEREQSIYLSEKNQESIEFDLSVPSNFYEGCESLLVQQTQSSTHPVKPSAKMLIEKILSGPETMNEQINKTRERSSQNESESDDKHQESVQQPPAASSKQMSVQADVSNEPANMMTFMNEGQQQQRKELRIGLSRRFVGKRHNPTIADLLKKKKSE